MWAESTVLMFLEKRVSDLEKRRRRRRKRRQASIVPIISMLIVVVLVVYGGIKAYNYAFNRGKEYVNSTTASVTSSSDEVVHIVIPEGAATKDIAEILKENGLIGSKLMFRMTSRSEGFDGTYIKGEYDIVKGLSPTEIMKIIQSGPIADESRKVTIPEGYTAKKIAALLDEKGIISSEEFINEMNNGEFDYNFLNDIPKRDYYLEGYLFPATYEFPKGSTAHDIICKMLDRFQIAYDNILKNADSKYSSDELITIASMIESEIQVDGERKTAAGVIYNRLEQGMKLQIDSTVQYANNTRNEVVTTNDLQIDSPYNTYKYEGLPLGPICNPGEAAIEAAVNPEDNDYLYYVVKQRGSGEHVFTSSYDEFLKAKEEYQKSFNN